MPRVSVIIPAYKPAHLPDALASVFAQSFTDYEVIVVNDGSPFGIRELLQPYLQAGKILYLEQDNRGVAAARNRGLAQARGEFIAYLDDDDYWPDDKLEWQVRYLDEHPETGVIVGDVEFIDASGRLGVRFGLQTGLIKIEDMFGGSKILSPGQTLVRKALIGARNGFDESFWGADDYDLWLDLAGRTAIMKTSTLALYYRLHPLNASRNSLSMCLNIQRVLQRHLPFVSAGRRDELKMASTRHLFQYQGQQLIRDWKRLVRDGKWGDSWKYLPAIFWFVRGSFADPAFLVTIGRALLPERFFAK
jgi:glycosyltransferase involved in cell wall biosynthesis